MLLKIEFLGILEVSQFKPPLLGFWIPDSHDIVAADVAMNPACTKHKAKG
jgi:hypothetical protein